MTIDEYNELQDQIDDLRYYHLKGHDFENAFWNRVRKILVEICHIDEFNVVTPHYFGKDTSPQYKVDFEQTYADEKARTFYQVFAVDDRVWLRAKGVMCAYFFNELSEQAIYEIIRNLGWMLEDNVRRCEKCGKIMMDGYYSDFLPYACSKECLLELFNGDEKAMQDALDNGDYVYKKFNSIF